MRTVIGTRTSPDSGNHRTFPSSPDPSPLPDSKDPGAPTTVALFRRRPTFSEESRSRRQTISSRTTQVEIVAIDRRICSNEISYMPFKGKYRLLPPLGPTGVPRFGHAAKSGCLGDGFSAIGTIASITTTAGTICQGEVIYFPVSSRGGHGETISRLQNSYFYCCSRRDGV